MIVNYDTEKINTALHDFYNATGITIDLLKTDFTKVSQTKYEFNPYCKCIQSSEKGKSACRVSEMKLLEKCKQAKKPQLHICHAGLVDMAVPIIYDDEIIGYIIFGQLKTDSDFLKVKDYIIKLGLDTVKTQDYYNRILFYDSDKLQSVSNVASMLVKFILLENMLNPSLEGNIQKAVNYINENLEKELTIKSISKNVNISKSVLYKKFHSFFNCTISEYINIKRIEKSVELLLKTDLSIEDISQKVGFASTSYFSKTFKKIQKISPLKYRKSNAGL